jgi:transcriptional regulator with XRE-family HTH domain
MLDVIEVQSRLGARVRARRAELGLTQAALAARACISRPSVANVEAGRQNVGLRQLVSLAQALDVEVAALLRE